MAEQPVTALLQDGPYDGQQRMVPPEVDVIYVGSIQAAFTDGDMTPPENLIGRDVVGYRLAETRDDGVRIYRYVQPATAPQEGLPQQCPLCHGTEFGTSTTGVRYCLACMWDDA